MLNRRIRFSTMGCMLLATLASTTPAHALPTPAVPLAVNAAAATVQVVIDGHTVGTFTELVSVSASHEPSAKSARKFSVCCAVPRSAPRGPLGTPRC